MDRSSHRRNAAFTQLELIVVMAIFAIAMGVLIPVVAKARTRSQEVFCQANLRILSTAFTQYTQEYQERYPFGFIFNKSNPTTARPAAGDSRYITWFSSIDKYMTSGTDELITLDGTSLYYDGATKRRFHAAFKCPSISSNFQQQVQYYQNSVVMPHMPREVPSQYRVP